MVQKIKRIISLMLAVTLLMGILSSCGQGNNSSQSSMSQIQSDISTNKSDDVQMRQVVIKRTQYDETDNMMEWIEYNYDVENQCEWHSYDKAGNLQGHGIEKYDNNWNLIEELQYNSYDILTWEEQYNTSGDMIYQAIYSDNGVLTDEYSWTYNDDGTESSYSVYNSPASMFAYNYRENKYTITHYYNSNGALIRNEREENGEKYNSRLYSYDENNRIIEEIVYASDGSILWTYFYEYDELGNTILFKQVYGPSGPISQIITYTYDDIVTMVENW